jgi:hypothetical protein
MSYIEHTDFIATAIATITTGATATNGSEFTSVAIPVDSDMAALAITFTHAGAGDGSNIDYYFQASYDGGTTWTTNEFILIQKASNMAPAAAGARVHAQVDWYQGISHLRLWKVVNNDAASITAVNATLSRGWARPQISFRH